LLNPIGGQPGTLHLKALTVKGAAFSTR